MPRLNYNRIRNRKYTYRKGDYEDLDAEDHHDHHDQFHFRNDWSSGRRGRRNQLPSRVNTELVRRMMGAPNSTGDASSSRGLTSPSGEAWVRVSIANGVSIPVDFLRETIGSVLGSPIRIYNFNIRGETCIFFFKIRSRKINECIKGLRTIKNPSTGLPILCDCRPCGEPEVPTRSQTSGGGDASGASAALGLLPEAWMEALRECFKERFQATSRVLDLSSLHTDVTLLNKGFYIPLNKVVVFSSFVAILQENSAQLAALNLSNNRLNHVQPFEDVAKALGQPTYSFERLDISGNHITSARNLEALKLVPQLCHIDLTETPLSGRLSHPSNGKHIEAQIVRILPGLKTLNGNPVKVTVQFAIEQGSTASEVSRAPKIPLPASVQGHFGSEAIRVPLLTFLMGYFGRYDSGTNRGDAIYPYYTAGSTLTFCLNQASQFTGKSVLETVEVFEGTEKKRIQLLTSNMSDAYFKSNRNLLRCKDEAKRHDLISHGPLNIASFLGRLPPSEHVLESFCVDVIAHSDGEIVFNVVGVFYELKPPRGPYAPLQKILRCFSRTMVLVAPGTQVLQDNIVISNPTEPLIQKYIRETKKRLKAETDAKVNGGSQPSTSASAAAAPSAQVSVLNGSNEEAILAEFRRQTGMNSAYSRQCLQEFNWQFETALNAFRTMQASGSIPQVAFAPE